MNEKLVSNYDIRCATHTLIEIKAEFPPLKVYMVHLVWLILGELWYLFHLEKEQQQQLTSSNCLYLPLALLQLEFECDPLGTTSTWSNLSPINLVEPVDADLKTALEMKCGTCARSGGQFPSRIDDATHCVGKILNEQQQTVHHHVFVCVLTF